MTSNGRRRWLVVGEIRYRWQVEHRHAGGDCEEILRLRRFDGVDGGVGERRVCFLRKPGFTVPGGAYTSSGVVGDDTGRWLNLHEPGTARVFVDALTDAGWTSADRGSTELDGWEWFDEAHRRRSAATATAAHLPPAVAE